MKFVTKILIIKFIFFINFCVYSFSLADNHNIYEIIDQLQKDIKTLEKAVYSGSVELNNTSVNSSNMNSSSNSEDVLTRHLLKLSEIENQFQQLTNKFEEINFKLDKLSNRMSKVQADNQMRFQDLETGISNDDDKKNYQKNQTMTQMKFCQAVLNLKI
jgi:TolA-binding protein